MICYLGSELFGLAECGIDDIQFFIRKYKDRGDGCVALQLINPILGDIFGLLIGALGNDLGIIAADGIVVNIT